MKRKTLNSQYKWFANFSRYSYVKRWKKKRERLSFSISRAIHFHISLPSCLRLLRISFCFSISLSTRSVSTSVRFALVFLGFESLSLLSVCQRINEPPLHSEFKKHLCDLVRNGKGKDVDGAMTEAMVRRIVNPPSMTDLQLLLFRSTIS